MKPTIAIWALLLTTSGVYSQTPRVLDSRDHLARREDPVAKQDTARADRRVRGPRLGLVFGQKTGLRVIRGVPGAASLGPRISGVPELRSWAVSPEGRYVLGIQAEDGRLAVLRAGKPVSVFFTEVKVADGALAVSPTGEAAAVYDESRGRLSVLEGLPRNASVSWSANLDSFPGEVSALAVRDDGQAVLAAAGNSLIEIPSNGRWRYIASLTGPALFAYLRNSPDAAYVDTNSKQAFLVRDVPGGAAVSMLVDESGGVTLPVGIAAMAGNDQILIANAGPGGVVSIDVRLGTVTTLSCRCRPSRLLSLEGGRVFQLTAADEGAIRLYDGSRPQPRTAFVPAASQGGVR